LMKQLKKYKLLHVFNLGNFPTMPRVGKYF